MSHKEGVRRFGERAIAAMLKEHAQIGEDDKRIFVPQKANELSREQKRKALRMTSLIKNKRSGQIKERMVVDGRRQRVHMSKDDVASPTYNLETLIMSWVIDGLEGRDVATEDVGGAFLLADITDFVLIKLDGEAVDIVVEANPSYQEYVMIENGKKVLCMKLRKSLCGIMQAAILWHETFSSCLKKSGFEINLCVINVLIESTTGTFSSLVINSSSINMFE